MRKQTSVLVFTLIELIIVLVGYGVPRCSCGATSGVREDHSDTALSAKRGAGVLNILEQ